MKYQTTRFGEIEVSQEKVISFPYGLIGFENDISFVLMKHKPESSFFWLQSLSTPSLAFSLLRPFEYVPGYIPVLSESDLEQLQSDNQNNLEIYSMVVIPKDPRLMTVNLLSPIVINAQKQLGVQIILGNSEYSVKHRLIPDTETGKKEKAG